MLRKYLSLFLIMPFALLAQSPSKQEARIISAGGSITELIYALDAGKNIIGVDTSSLYPHEKIRDLPKIGYFRQLSAEGLLSLQPTVLVGAVGVGPRAVLEQLSESGVEVKLFKQDKYSLAAWQKLVMDIAVYFNKTETAKQFINEKLDEIKRSQANRKYPEKSLNAVFLMSVGQRGLMVAGQKTTPNLLLNLASLNNVAIEIDGYKTMTNEGLIEAKLDMIVMPAHVLKSSGGKEAICQNQTIKLALKGDCNLLIMDPLLALGMGSRIDVAVKTLMDFANKLNN